MKTFNRSELTNYTLIKMSGDVTELYDDIRRHDLPNLEDEKKVYSSILDDIQSIDQRMNYLCDVELKHEKTISKIKGIPLIGKLLIKKLES